MGTVADGVALKAPNKWLTLTGIGLGAFLGALDSNIMNVALPTLAKDLHSDFATVQWVVVSYLLVLTGCMLAVARLGDMYDKKKIYAGGLLVFTISSLLCSLASGVGSLVACRVLQGAGAAMMQALGYAIVTATFPSSERGRAFGILGAITSLAIMVGPALSGVLIGLSGWRAVFLINLPLGILALGMVLRFVPAVAGQPGQKFDFVGALVLLIALLGYAVGMTLGQRIGFGDPQTLALLVAAGLALLAFVIVETHIRQPMVDLRLFRNPLFGLNLSLCFLAFVVIAGSYTIPFVLELAKGYTAQQVGLLMMAMPISMVLVSPIAGALSDRLGATNIGLAGLLLTAAGCLAVTLIDASITPLGIALISLPSGIGYGLFQAPNNSAIMGAAPRGRTGVASGLLNLSRTLGNTTGVPLMGAIFAAQTIAAGHLAPHADVTTAGAAALMAGLSGTYRVAMWIMLAATVLAALASWLSARGQARTVAVQPRRVA